MGVVRTLVLALALLQALGIVDLVRRAACEAECEGDGCDNDCTPGTDSPLCPCHCPGSPAASTPPIASVKLAAPTASAPVTFDRAERGHASPDPREILHVPRPRAV